MRGRTILLALACASFAGGASAAWYWPSSDTNETAKSSSASKSSWYWPFGSDKKGGKDEPRLSALMEPASLAIDEATDLIADGKTDEAVEKYREALRVLEQLEVKYPERAASPEFQSVRNKRAYVDAQLNAILLEEARVNAKAVAVTDTTDLEEKLRKKRAGEAAERRADPEKAARAADGKPKLESELKDFVDDARARAKKIDRAAAAARFERESEEKIAALLKADPASRKARLLRAGLELYRQNYGSARKDIDELLEKDPKDVSALNLLAALEAATGDEQKAEVALVKAINANRKDSHAYYNLAKLLIRRGGAENLDRARTLYKAGRKSKSKGGPGGPADPFLEKALKQ